MKKPIKLKLGPKARKFFTEAMLAGSAYVGPEEIENVKETVIMDEDGKIVTYGEPVVIKVNKSFGQKVAGQVIKYVSEHVEIEPVQSHSK